MTLTGQHAVNQGADGRVPHGTRGLGDLAFTSDRLLTSYDGERGGKTCLDRLDSTPSHGGSYIC